MALTNGELQQQLDALETAYYSGTLKVKYGDREVNYRTADEMLRIISRLKKKLGLTSNGIKMVQASYEGNK